jgi:hypothetical protein
VHTVWLLEDGSIVGDREDIGITVALIDSAMAPKTTSAAAHKEQNSNTWTALTLIGTSPCALRKMIGTWLARSLCLMREAKSALLELFAASLSFSIYGPPVLQHARRI